MARKSIRDFSGGLVTYQSELDISDNQFQEFDNAINTKRGSITKKGTNSNQSVLETHLSNLLIQNLYAIVLKKMVVVMILALNGGY